MSGRSCDVHAKRVPKIDLDAVIAKTTSPEAACEGPAQQNARKHREKKLFQKEDMLKKHPCVAFLQTREKIGMKTLE